MIKLPGIKSYLGGKAASGTAERIINLIRPHDTLVIPFAGNCAITRKIKWPTRVLINDLDTTMVDAWRAANLGPQLEVHNLQALDFLKMVLQRPDLGRIVVYCDPPYPHETRTSANFYNHEMTYEQHLELLEVLRWLRVDCLVSTYPNDLYAAQLSHWQRTEFQSMTRGGPRTEWLFYNYPEPTVLHDDRFSGCDYREREYMKRKTETWVRRYKAMQPYEQQRILGRILENTPSELVKKLVEHR
jgi:site-specific DNA-adenine methylase